MKLKESQHELKSKEGLPLRVDLRVPAEAEPQGIVVIVHGFKGFKDWGFFPHTARALAADGFASACFDFSLNGVGERPGEFDRLDLFERNTYAHEIEDLQGVIAWLRADAPLSAATRQSKLGLLAHSRGALSAIVVASEDLSIPALVSWNGISSALHYGERQLKKWEEKGRMEFVNSRTHQRMAVGFALVEDARANAQRYDLVRAVRTMRAAHLIVQAENDLAVDPSNAEVLRAGRPESEDCHLVRIEDAGHTFNAVHPFAKSTPPLEEALRVSSMWFSRHLR